MAKRNTPQAVTQPKKTDLFMSDIIIKLYTEYQDRNRKKIDTWRQALEAAENPEDPRWYLMQDLIEDLIIDAHLSSVIDVRKTATLNHSFYVIDKKTGEKLEEQTDTLQSEWFYNFVDVALDAIFRKYSLLQVYKSNEVPAFELIPRRNICPTWRRVYLEVAGEKFINYNEFPDVIEIVHQSKFGLINDVIPNVIWKRSALQAYAEYSERFGFPLITATTSNKKEVPAIEKGLKNLGQSGSGVLPSGTDITIHDLANSGNPEKVFVENAKLQDNQVSKRMVGSTTMVDEGSNRAQTQVHAETLDDKISVSDRRFITFLVNNKLFPQLQRIGFKFDNTKMAFQFDESKELGLKDQWDIVSDAMNRYELDENVLIKRFNLPIIGKKKDSGSGFSQNFQ